MIVGPLGRYIAMNELSCTAGSTSQSSGGTALFSCLLAYENTASGPSTAAGTVGRHVIGVRLWSHCVTRVACSPYRAGPERGPAVFAPAALRLIAGSTLTAAQPGSHQRETALTSQTGRAQTGPVTTTAVPSGLLAERSGKGESCPD